MAHIRIGERTNIQDGTVIHGNSERKEIGRPIMPTDIGNDVTVGHKALLHACTIHDNSFIGMGAIIMDGVTVESEAMVAAGALVTIGKTVKAGELWAGSPAKCVRKLSAQEIEDMIRWNSRVYVEFAEKYNRM